MSLILALDQLPQLDELNSIRRANAESLRDKIKHLELFSMPGYRANDTAVFHMVTINVTNRDTGARDRVLRALQVEGVPAVTYVLPGCDAKVAASFEIPWNYVERNEDLVTDIANALEKIERNFSRL